MNISIRVLGCEVLGISTDAADEDEPTVVAGERVGVGFVQPSWETYEHGEGR